MRILVLIFITFISCHTNDYSQKVSSQMKTNKNGNSGDGKEIESIRKWNGNIGSNIPVFVWFKIKDSVIIGQINYIWKQPSTPIKLLGVLTKTGIKLNEFSSDGTITGILNGKMNKNNFVGTWFSPKSRKEFPFALNKKDTVLNNVDTEFYAKSIIGQYLYSFDKNGAQGSLKISKNKSLISLCFFNITDAPARNIAELKLDSLTLSDNEIIYKLDDSESCMFRIRFFKNFAVVNYLNDERYCGFGNNADIDGIYLKTTQMNR